MTTACLSCTNNVRERLKTWNNDSREKMKIQHDYCRAFQFSSFLPHISEIIRWMTIKVVLLCLLLVVLSESKIIGFFCLPHGGTRYFCSKVRLGIALDPNHFEPHNQTKRDEAKKIHEDLKVWLLYMLLIHLENSWYDIRHEARRYFLKYSSWNA